MTAIRDAFGSETKVAVGLFPTILQLSSGNRVIMWFSTLGSPRTARLQVLDEQNNPVGDEFRFDDNRDSTYSLTELTDGNFLVVYTSRNGTLAQTFAPNGEVIGAARLIIGGRDVDVSATADGGYVIGIIDNSRPSLQFVTGNEGFGPRVTGITDLDTVGVTVETLDNGNVIVIWSQLEEVGTQDGYDVFARIYGPDGSELTSSFRVNDTAEGSHGSVEAAVLSDGTVAITWIVFGNSPGVFVRLYSDSGEALSDPIRANDLENGQQSDVSITALPDSGFILSWVDRSNSNPIDQSGGIRARVFTNSGDPIGGAFQVNAQRFGDEVTPEIIVTGDNEALAIYRASGNADPSGILIRSLNFPTLGTQQSDTIEGSPSLDRFAGLEGDDIINGNAGDDVIDGGAGNDTLDGGAGNDTASYETALAGVTVSLLSQGTLQNTVGADADLLTNFENLRGSDFDDNLTGDNQGNVLFGGLGDDVLIGGGGSDWLFGAVGDDTLSGGDNSDTIVGGLGDDMIDGGSNIDTVVIASSSERYVVRQTDTGVFELFGVDGRDLLTNVEFAQFDDETIRLRPGEGVAVNFETADPSVYQEAMNAILDFDGNALGGDGSWLRIGSADVNGDGDIDQLLVNDAIGRFATVGTADDGLVYFNDNSWAGETRVAGIYIDPLVEAGEVERFSDNDSQRRFQNDLQIENINRVLGADDYDGDGFQDVYFALTDGTAYLRAIMEADGNISYANYQSEQEVIDFLEANGFGEETYGDWFSGGATASQSGEQVQSAQETGAPEWSAMAPVHEAIAINTFDAHALEFFG